MAVSTGMGGVAHLVSSYSTTFGAEPDRKNIEAKEDVFFFGVFGVGDEGASFRMSGKRLFRPIGGGAAESKDVPRVDAPHISEL